MQAPLILIGPISTGKSTLAPLLAEKLHLPRYELDEKRWDYYAEIGYDSQVAKQIADEQGMLALLEHWKPYEAHAVTRIVQEYPDGVIDFGAGHSVYEDAALFAKVEAALAPFPNVILILPTEDKAAAVEILNTRFRDLLAREVGHVDERLLDLNRHFVMHPSNEHLAKHIFYSHALSPDEFATQIIEQLAQQELAHLSAAWQLQHPERLYQSVIGQVYRVQRPQGSAILKLLFPVGVMDEKNAPLALNYWQGRGAVQVYAWSDEAQLLEEAVGEDLLPLVKAGRDAEAMAILGDILAQLHPPSVPQPLPAGLTPLRHWFRALFQKAAADEAAGMASIYTRAAKITERLLNTPLNTHVLHGDLHHENVKYHPERGWLCFDPKALVGESTYDAANVLCNPLDMPELTHHAPRLLDSAAILADKMQLPVARILAFTYASACLSAAWMVEDGLDATHDLGIAALIEPHLATWF